VKRGAGTNPYRAKPGTRHKTVQSETRHQTAATGTPVGEREAQTEYKGAEGQEPEMNSAAKDLAKKATEEARATAGAAIDCDKTAMRPTPVHATQQNQQIGRFMQHSRINRLDGSDSRQRARPRRPSQARHRGRSGHQESRGQKAQGTA
jgi:hypothetical protein